MLTGKLVRGKIGLGKPVSPSGRTRDLAKASIPYYIETFCNRTRCHVHRSAHQPATIPSPLSPSLLDADGEHEELEA